MAREIRKRSAGLGALVAGWGLLAIVVLAGCDEGPRSELAPAVVGTPQPARVIRQLADATDYYTAAVPYTVTMARGQYVAPSLLLRSRRYRQFPVWPRGAMVWITATITGRLGGMDTGELDTVGGVRCP